MNNKEENYKALAIVNNINTNLNLIFKCGMSQTQKQSIRMIMGDVDIPQMLYSREAEENIKFKKFKNFIFSNEIITSDVLLFDYSRDILYIYNYLQHKRLIELIDITLTEIEENIRYFELVEELDYWNATNDNLFDINCDYVPDDNYDELSYLPEGAVLDELDEELKDYYYTF